LIKPIPRKLLIHSVIYKRRTGTDASGEPVYDAPQTLFNVRVSPQTTYYAREVNQWAQSAAESTGMTLYIDTVNSTVPAEINLADIVIFEGKEYAVKSIKPRYALDGAKPHHYEIVLM
jgi:hypothetical protein